MRSQPLFGIGRGLEQIADVVLDAQRQQDDIDLKQQAVLLDNRLDELKEEIKEEPDFAKRDELYRTRAAEYLQETTGQISSQRVKQGLNQYYSIKFPREALKTKVDNQKEWGEHRVAQTDALGDLMADRITNTDDPREVQKYQALYKDQLDSLSIGPYAPLNAIRRQNMEQAFNVKVLDRRAKRMIGQNAYGFMVAANEGQFDQLPDLEKYRSMARGEIEHQERISDKVSSDIRERVMNAWYAKANQGKLTPAEADSLLKGESQYITPQQGAALVERNNNPPTGESDDAIKAIRAAYRLTPGTERDVVKYMGQMNHLFEQSGRRSLGKTFDDLINELQSDLFRAKTLAASQRSNEIAEANRQIHNLQTEYNADKEPEMKALEGLFGNEDNRNRARIETEYRRGGYEAAKRLKESLAKQQNNATKKVTKEHEKAANY